MVCRVENRVMGIGNCSIKMQGWKLWGHENAEPPNQTVRVENTRIKMLGSEMQDWKMWEWQSISVYCLLCGNWIDIAYITGNLMCPSPTQLWYVTVYITVEQNRRDCVTSTTWKGWGLGCASHNQLMSELMCWKSVDNDDNVPVLRMNYLWMHTSQTQMHNVSHTVGRWYPSQMRGGPELVVVVDGEAGAAFHELECD